MTRPSKEGEQVGIAIRRVFGMGQFGERGEEGAETGVNSIRFVFSLVNEPLSWRFRYLSVVCHHTAPTQFKPKVL